MFKSYFKKILPNERKKSLNHLDIPTLFGSDERVGVNAYQTNAIVHRCVSLIATSASHVPWLVYTKNSTGKTQLSPQHPANQLLKHPNAHCSGAEFFNEAIASLLLYGDNYLLLSCHRNGQIPATIHNLPANQVAPIIQDHQLIGYEYGPHRQRFNLNAVGVSKIKHLKNYHPTNTQRGLSNLAAATSSINLYNKIMDWNKALLNNASRPSGVLAFQNGNGYLTEEQFERLKKQFYTNFSGSTNSGRPLILEGGLQWQDTNQAARFEKFIELKDSSARDIAIAFNVPPQLLGINGDNTYSNMQEARLALWEENIIPLLDKYSDALSNWLSNWYLEDLIIDFDRDAISVLTKRRENLWAKIANANFMTLNEKRAFVGLPAVPGGDKLIQE